MSTSVKVRFKGTEYWLLCDADGDCGALAPLDHCNDEGHVVDFEIAFAADSFAHLFPDGRLMRYGQQIGTREDLERV